MSGHRTMQVEAIANGTVLDHIPSVHTLRVAAIIADPGDQVFIGVNLRSGKLGTKGVIKIAARELSEQTLSRIALLAPRATICVIRDYQVARKVPMPLPAAFRGIARCPNRNCVTNHERWPTEFEVRQEHPLVVRCRFCERSFPADELVIA